MYWREQAFELWSYVLLKEGTSSIVNLDAFGRDLFVDRKPVGGKQIFHPCYLVSYFYSLPQQFGSRTELQ